VSVAIKKGEIISFKDVRQLNMNTPYESGNFSLTWVFTALVATLCNLYTVEF